MKLSIITINYNNLEGLKKTYESVVCQTCQDFEWIIIDGGSTDGSREFIEEHQDKFAYWCSEPDKGIYNAMNKGITNAIGEYLQFLNSGDNLVNNRIVEEFLALGWNDEVISGDVIVDGDKERRWCNPEESALDFCYMYNVTIFHPSSYINRSLFERYGMYDETLHIVSDWKFFLEVLIIYNCSYRYWDKVVANFTYDGISSKPENLQLCKEERQCVLRQYGRIMRAIEKRDKRIQELDLPVMTILRRKAWAKIRTIFRKFIC